MYHIKSNHIKTKDTWGMPVISE